MLEIFFSFPKILIRWLTKSSISNGINNSITTTTVATLQRWKWSLW